MPFLTPDYNLEIGRIKWRIGNNRKCSLRGFAIRAGKS